MFISPGLYRHERRYAIPFVVMVALGIVFQIPAVIFVLSRIGLITAGMLVRYFRQAVVGCVVVAAIITPTTDF